MVTRKNNAFSMRRTMRGVVKKVNCFHKDLVLANHNTPDLAIKGNDGMAPCDDSRVIRAV